MFCAKEVDFLSLCGKCESSVLLMNALDAYTPLLRFRILYIVRSGTNSILRRVSKLPEVNNPDP